MKHFCRLFIFLSVLSCWIPNPASAQVVNMPDASLAAIVRNQLDLAPNAPITRQALQRLRSLWASSYYASIQQLIGERAWIKDLTGLEHATELKELYLNFHDISDLSPLKRLTGLIRLQLTGNEISDLSPLKGLTQLRWLEISFNPINDFSSLARLTQLRRLRVTVRSVELMSNLRRHVDLTQLEYLAIHGDGNQIGDLRPFANLTQLEHFVVFDAQIRDVTPIKNLTQLTYLELGRNEISDITPLAGLTQLEQLHLSDNQIRDVTPLTGLTQLKTLGLRRNQIRDVTPIENLRATLWLEGNPIGGGPDLVIEDFLAPLAQSLSLGPNAKRELSVTVKNKGTAESKPTTLKFYRSTDKNISPTDDTVLKTLPIKALPADGTAEASYTVIATETPSIYYYYACVESVDNEEKPDNNCTAALEIVMRGLQPDLHIRFIKVAKNGTSPKKDWKGTLDLKPGDAFDMRVIVRNAGEGTAEATHVIFYRSNDAEISEADVKLKTIENPELPPKETHTHFVTFRIPEATGTYYYGAKVEPVKYEDQTHKNWSVGVRIGAEDLEPPENLISDIVLTQNATYFVVNAQFPKLLIKNQGQATYGGCVITLDIEGVPDLPWEDWKANDPWITGEPPYFMFPLLSPQQRIDALALEDTYDLDAKDIVIGGIATAVGVGVGEKVLPLIPLGKVAQHTDKIAAGVLRIGSKFKLLIPADKVKKRLAGGGRFVISKTIGATAKFLTATGLKTASNLIGGNEEEPSIADELLAFTADPTLILVPTSEQETHPTGEARYLFRIPKQQLTEIQVTIEQVYFVGENAYTAKYQGVYPLGGAAAAPGLVSMSLADYPPFQWLSPEAQAYLLRDFGMFTSAETWQVPATTALLPNYPNPFNPETWIPYQLAKPSDVSLTLHDINGRVVRDLDVGHQRAGVYRSRSRAAYWDGKNAQGEPVASGVYFYTLKAGDFTATRKMLIRK